VTGIGQIAPRDIITAFRTLDHGKCVLATKPMTSFILPPAMIHAVITIERSSHMTGSLCGLGFFEESMIMLRRWMEEFSVAKIELERENIDDHLPRITQRELHRTESVKEIADALGCWALFLVRNTEPDDSRRLAFSGLVSQWLDLAEEVLAWQRKTKTQLEHLDLLKEISQGMWRIMVEET